MLFFLLLSLLLSISLAVKPILIIPGFGGSQLEQKETGITILEKHEFCCSTQFDWTRTWVVLSDIIPYAWECFAARVSRNFINNTWYDKPNVFTRNIQGLNAIDYLDPSNFITRRETIYFANLVAALHTVGYNATNLAGAPYDWRLVPFEQKDYFDNVKQLIEKMSINSGERVIITTHSMGGAYLHYFLSNLVDQKWKSKYVEKWISVASPFIGSPKGILAVVSGYNFGIPIVTSSEGLEIGPYIGASYYLMPREATEWQNLVTTTKGLTFNSSQISSLLTYASVPLGSAKFASSTKEWSIRDPGVEIALVSGVNINTDYNYLYDDEAFTRGPVSVKFASGDGTVPEISSFYPTKLGWNVTAVQKFNGLDHVGILANSQFITWFLKEVKDKE
jgi:lysophospholipase III